MIGQTTNLPASITVDDFEYTVADLPEDLQNLLALHCNATLQYQTYERMVTTLAGEIAHGVQDWSAMNAEQIPDLHVVNLDNN